MHLKCNFSYEANQAVSAASDSVLEEMQLGLLLVSAAAPLLLLHSVVFSLRCGRELRLFEKCLAGRGCPTLSPIKTGRTSGTRLRQSNKTTVHEGKL